MLKREVYAAGVLDYTTYYVRDIAGNPYGQGFSPYEGMANNPVMMIDPDGGGPFTWLWRLLGIAKDDDDTKKKKHQYRKMGNRQEDDTDIGIDDILDIWALIDTPMGSGGGGEGASGSGGTGHGPNPGSGLPPKPTNPSYDDPPPDDPPGKKVADEILNANDANTYRGVDCCITSLRRYKKAYKKVHGHSLNEDLKIPYEDFEALWYTKFLYRKWKLLKQKGYGAPGALIQGGLVETDEVLQNKDIWDDKKLKPGAFIQVWKTRDKLMEMVNQGTGADGGHSFIFREYVYDTNGNVTGMNVLDQFGTSTYISRKKYLVWFGVNIY